MPNDAQKYLIQRASKATSHKLAFSTSNPSLSLSAYLCFQTNYVLKVLPPPYLVVQSQGPFGNTGRKEIIT